MSECGISETELGSGAHIYRIVVSDEAVPFVARGGRVQVLDKSCRVLALVSAAFTPEEMREVRKNQATLA
jgi:hypothetical protein